MIVLAVLGAYTYAANCEMEISPQVRRNYLQRVGQCREKMLFLPFNWGDRGIALKNAWRKAVQTVALSDKDGTRLIQLMFEVKLCDVLTSKIYADATEDQKMHDKQLTKPTISVEQFIETIIGSSVSDIINALKKMLEERDVWVGSLCAKCQELHENRTKAQKERAQAFKIQLEMTNILASVCKKRLCVKVVSIVSALVLIVFHMISLWQGLFFIAALAGFAYHDYTGISTFTSTRKFFKKFKFILEQKEKVHRCEFDLFVKKLNLNIKQAVYNNLHKNREAFGFSVEAIERLQPSKSLSQEIAELDKKLEERKSWVQQEEEDCIRRRGAKRL